MDDKYILGPNGELYHWGIKGMKWGRRLYQNKDGSLTALGKKRYSSENAKLKAREKEIKGREKAAARQAKLDAKKAELDAREAALKGGKKDKTDPKPNAPKRKTITDMTDDELRELTNRIILEKNFYEARNNLAKADPEPQTFVDKLKDKYLDDIVSSVVIEPAKKYVSAQLGKKLGIDEKDPIKALEKTRDKLKLEKEIRDLKKGEPTLKELIERYGNLTPEERNVIEFAANNRFFEEGLRGKGVKPDKGKDKKKKDDDDD